MSSTPVHRAPRKRWNDPERLPLYVVAAAVVFGLVALWPEHRDVWYLNDAAVHRSMTQWAADRMRAGHLPFDGWYPYLALGASRFHHYQSLPHILTAAASLLVGPGTFRWSLYLLLATWPISVYAGGRLLGLGRWPSAAAALLSPLLSSQPGLGYEWSSYVWRGSGTWAQLWGMWALPFAIGLTWQAVAKGRRLWLAAAVLGLTVVLHLLTGYLALLCLGVFVLVVPDEFFKRLGRAALVGLGALLFSAWMLIPLTFGAKWTINDEFSRGTYYYDSFGARRVMGWFVSGKLFDAGRLPIVTLLLAVGLVLAIRGFTAREQPRVILGVGLLSLLLFFGRPTLGPILKLLPGGGDLFLRRYIMGVHLMGLYLAGLGLVWLWGFAARQLRERAGERFEPRWRTVGLLAAAVVILLPPVIERVSYESKDWTWIPQQIEAQATDGAGYQALVQRAEAEGPGRLFSDLRTTSDNSYRVGFVPAYMIPLNLQVDSIGFTRPTWSLASGAEARYRAGNPTHPPLFGVRYVIFPQGWTPPPGATRIAQSGRHILYEYPDVDYVSLVDTVAPIAANRDDIGRQMASFLDSGLPGLGYIPTVAYAGRPAARPTLGANREPRSSPGRVLSSFSSITDGVFGATVDATRPSVLMVKASFDPGFRALVDGREVPVQMVAPAFVGVPVPPGRHDVFVTYQSYPWYGPLFLLGIGAILLMWFAQRPRGRGRRGRRATRDGAHRTA